MQLNSEYCSRALDHCVLPVADIAVARERMTKLGFTVAPNGYHPFGTINCCIFFADDTFIEPLAIGDGAQYKEAGWHRNEFIRRDFAFRFRRGEEGFSAVVFKTDDAQADHDLFRSWMISAGETLTFSRPAIDLEGNEDIAEFKLAFAADLRAPDILFFTCERVRSPMVDRSALQRHDNGVIGISRVILSEPRPEDFAEFMSKTVGPAVSVLDNDQLKNQYLQRGSHARGLRARVIVFSVEDLENTRRLLSGRKVVASEASDRIIVPAEPGQGTTFAFEQAHG